MLKSYNIIANCESFIRQIISGDIFCLEQAPFGILVEIETTDEFKLNLV